MVHFFVKSDLGTAFCGAKVLIDFRIKHLIFDIIYCSHS